MCAMRDGAHVVVERGGEGGNRDRWEMVLWAALQEILLEGIHVFPEGDSFGCPRFQRSKIYTC